MVAYKDDRRCTAHTINAVCSHYGVKGIERGGKAPIHGMGVLDHFKKNGLKWTPKYTHLGKSVNRFIEDHPTGVHYISTAGHAMALIHGKLHDTAPNRSNARRKIVAHFEITKPLHEDMAGPTNAVGGGNVAGLGVGPQGEPGGKKKTNILRRKTFKQFVKGT